MKSIAVIALIGGAQAKPLIHPETKLAITTTGQHWYGQPPLAMAERSDKDVGVTHYDPWVKQFVSGIVSPVPTSGRATSPDGTWKRKEGYASDNATRMAQVDPVKNTCTNANKATGEDQDCSTAGNSAWNTISSSRTGDPTKALAPPYPDHALK